MGLYSGAAADGIDAALVEVRSRRERMKVRQIASLHEPYDPQLHRRVIAATGGGEKIFFPPGAAAELDRDIGSAFAAAACKIIDDNRGADVQIAAIGSSGQHVARSKGVQGGVAELSAGCPAIIAHQTHAAVVADFSAGDLAADGNGGCTWAWPNWLLFHDRRLSRVVIQLGAIAKLTFIGGASSADEVVAFDLGPGTALIDQLAQKFCNRPFDADGAIAAHGSVNHVLLNELLGDGYSQKPAPKTAPASLWGQAALWRTINMGETHRCSGADLVATVTETTARSVARAVAGLTELPHEVVLSGGGAMNIHLAGRIRNLLSPCSTYAVEHYGMSLRGHGAVCCAILAAARLDGFAAHCPRASGAKRQVVLGSVTL